MARWYGMNIRIKGFDPEKQQSIQDALEEEWEFNWNDELWHGELGGYGEGNLCGGMEAEEMAQVLTEIVWKANGAYCEVVVDSTYLEDLPSECHTTDEEDYERFVQMGCSAEEEG